MPASKHVKPGWSCAALQAWVWILLRVIGPAVHAPRIGGKQMPSPGCDPWCDADHGGDPDEPCTRTVVLGDGTDGDPVTITLQDFTGDEDLDAFIDAVGTFTLDQLYTVAAAIVDTA